MAGDRGVSFPIAALSVVALFLSTTFLGQHAYDLMRLGESDADKRLQQSQPPVEARLWEDPFSALNRYRAKLKELCAGDVGPNGVRRTDPRCARGERDSATFRQDFEPGAENLTVIAAMLPGAAFIGVEEARRRVRYAVLAGLNAEGYVPDDSEHMGLLHARRCQRLTGCEIELGALLATDNPPPQTWDAALKTLMGNRRLLSQALAQPPRMDILYETLSAQSEVPGQGQPGDHGGMARERRRVVVLWIDDTAVAPRWLSAIAILLAEVVPDKARLRVIGPYRSDDLVRALADDLPAVGRAALEIKRASESAVFQKNAQTLARLRLISPFSTAPASQLRGATAGLSTLPECTEGVPGKDCVAEAFEDLLRPIGGTVGSPPFFFRTIGTDDGQIKLLVRELCARGLADNAAGRVILLSEWDSIYARTFAQALKNELHCLKGNRFKLENYPYLRGLDGANVDGAARQVRLVPRGDKSKDDKEPSIEWPESRDQRDYVRRLVEQIKLEAESGGPKAQVRAVGVIGTDVNDKLLLVQALRGAFSDRVLFTTDIDARLLHPEAVRYTRNLIVASSLPLVLDDEVLDQKLRARVAPFRDMYQTATFLGARYASADDKQAALLHPAIEKRLEKPTLYEIGRDSEVELGIDKVLEHERDRRIGYALLTGVLLLVLGGFMLGRPAPAMQAALPWNKAPPAPFDLSTAIVAGLEVAAWGFALGVVIELGLPGHMGPVRVWLLALALMILFWALVYPGLRFPPAAERADVYVASAPAWRRQQLVLRLLLIVLPLCLVWLWLVPEAGGMREPFAPTSGVSAWPSQLLRTLAVVLFAWFLDYAWGKSAAAARRIGSDYFPAASPQTAEPPPMPLSRRMVDAIALLRAWWQDRARMVRSNWRGFAGERLGRLARGLAEDSIWFWRPQVAHEGSVDGALVWHEYQRLLRNGPRLGRLLVWLVVAVVFLSVESYLVGGGQPEIPARGLDDRALFWTTILAHVLGTIILLVLVADATVLTWRFIGILKGGRTIYPRATIERFAAELGPELEAVAAEPIAANIDARTGAGTGAGPVPRNSLLDDWIDARLLAQHTAAIGPLIVFPFILVGLLVVARSQLFDNWAISGPVLAGLVCFVLWSIAMAALLNFGAEIARRRAIERMEEDLLWLQGRGAKYKALAERFPTLIEKVRKLRQGAFAPFFEQPLVQAILVPLGGAGGVQLIEMFMFART